MGKIPYCGKEFHQPRRNGKWTPERVEQARKLAASGLTKAEVAEEMGTSRGRLLHALARYPQSGAQA